jgi:hypothetical protein
MQVMYNQRTQKWVQAGSIERPLTIGKLKKRLSFESEVSSDYITFKLQEKDQHIGPLIGIMTTDKTGHSLAGNTSLFIQIQEELLARGALSYVFSYHQVIDRTVIEGYVYLPDKRRWLKAVFPLPDLIYNRIPYRHVEETLQFEECRQHLKTYQIPMFNPGFIDKYTLYQILATNEDLYKYLPDTVLVDTKEQLEIFFNKYRDIYLKPRNLSKGRNILRLYDNFRLEAKSQIKDFKDFSSFWDYFIHTYSDTSYIAQRTIHSATRNDLRFDFRILAHWSSQKQSYVVTGVGIRASNSNLLTTHTVNGGRILPYQDFQEPEHDVFIHNVVQMIGHKLTENIGFFGEFSIDAGMDFDKNYILYEVNSKPMSFDEPEIQQNRIHNLCDLFFQYTGF